MLKLTFFHDVICPYCYVENKRLKKVLADFRGEVELIHKSFAIIPEEDDIKSLAPGPEEAREVFFKEFEIIKRYIPEYDLDSVKKKAKFTYVWSVPALRACKAAELLGGMEAHGKYFDEAQRAFFEEGEDITSEEVLAGIAERIGLEKEKFVETFRSKRSYLAYVEDETEAKAMGIRGVPALLINDLYVLRGLQTEETIRTVLEDIINYGEPKRIQLRAYWEE